MCRAVVEWLASLAAWVRSACFERSVTFDGGLEVSVGRQVAEGGFSRVLGGTAAGGARVVVKELRCEEREQAARAEREILSCRACAHESVVRLLDSGVRRDGGARVYGLVFPRYDRGLRGELDARLVHRPAPPLAPRAAAAVLADVAAGAARESELPNFKGSFLGRFPLVSADLWTSDHLSARPRSVDAFPGTRARGTLTLKRR